MLLTEMIFLKFWVSHKTHKHTVWTKCSFPNVKANGTYCNHYAFRGMKQVLTVCKLCIL